VNEPRRKSWNERMPYVWAGICAFLVLAVALAILIGLHGVSAANHSTRVAQAATTRAQAATRVAEAAAHRAQAVAACINTNLGLRAGPANRDSAAIRQFISAVNDLFLSPAATMAQRQAEAEHFHRVVRDVKATLIADQADKNAHPLGRC
jgi:hypothetical protein